jgi:hypothetical protein
MRRRLAPVIAVVLCAGCGSAIPGSPTGSSSVVSPAGNWSGSISDAISGSGIMQLALSETTPNALSGTWSATFKNGDSFSGPAVAQAVLPTGYGITLYVQEPLAPCQTGPGGGSAPLSFTLINVVATSSQLTAVSGRLSCNGSTLGTVTLSRL